MIDLRPTDRLAPRKRHLKLALPRSAAACLCGLFMTVIANTDISVIAQDLVQSEARLKSAFIFNFAKFVEWPGEAFAETNSPLVVAIVGKDTLGPALDQVIQNKSVNGRPVI